MFDDMLNTTPAPSTSSSPTTIELQTYLASPVDPSVRDALMWWYNHRFEYPRLSRMARDYLSIPPTSVNVERVFSRGRILLSYLRNRMSAETTRSLMCLNSWLKAGILKNAAVVAAIRRIPEVEVIDVDKDTADSGSGVMDLD
jgi:hAT family C-terminal dimerisation region